MDLMARDHTMDLMARGHTMIHNNIVITINKGSLLPLIPVDHSSKKSSKVNFLYEKCLIVSPSYVKNFDSFS